MPMPILDPAFRISITRSRVGRDSVFMRGFTLIELMIVVAIVAILAGVALPSYSDYVRRGSLPEAFSGMADYRLKMEQYYQDNRNYGAAACADTNPPAWATFSSANNKFFDFACTLGAGGQGYMIAATGKSGTRAAGHVYSVNQGSDQETTTFKGAVVSKTCWLVKGSEC